MKRAILGVVVAVVAGLAMSEVRAEKVDAQAQSCSARGIKAGGCVVKSPTPKVAAPDSQALLERMQAAYAALGSYADTGTIVIEERPIGATLIREQYTFSTRYAAPRRFHFDFRKSAGQGGERFVIWSAGETFSSWWSATGVKEDYAKGEGANAFAVGTLPTSGTALLIPPLLFQNAGLQGPLLTLSEPKYAGSQKLNGRLVHAVTGVVPLNHWNDSVRVTTLWIDAETMMIRKVFEDTPLGQGDIVQRATTTFEPALGAKLEDAQFRFSPPK